MYPKANKALGQHFLVSDVVINKICQDYADECDVIIEVGPGPGVLTKNLASHKKPLYLIEKDNRFKDILLECTTEERIFIQDALEFNWSDFLEKESLFDKKIWLVSNLPYNVGSVLFVQFLPIEPIKYMSLMFQKEVGQKTYIRDAKNQMNGLLSLSLNYFNSRMLAKVSPGCFNPPPKVDSIVVSYQRKASPVINDFESFNAFTRMLFSGKRKQISTTLKSHKPNLNTAVLEDKLDFKLNLRAEALSFDQVIALFTHIS